MSVIVVSGKADNWWDAAMEHYDHVAAYAGKSMRKLDTRGYWIDKACDYYMRVVEEKWEKGKDLRLSLKYLVSDSKRRAVREQNRRPLARVAQELIEQMDTVIDVRVAVQKLDEVAQRILILLSQGYSWKEVEAETGWSVWTISKVREELGRLLVDYQPAVPPKKRGRGRPKRTDN